LLDGSELVLPKDIRYRERKKWRQIAAKLQENTVSVPERLAPVFYSGELQFLKNFVYLGDEEEHPFRAALVRDSGELVSLSRQESLEGFRLSYDPRLGYVATEICKQSL
jgi:CRISPR-associated endonuclease/helicase Cas3